MGELDRVGASLPGFFWWGGQREAAIVWVNGWLLGVDYGFWF